MNPEKPQRYSIIIPAYNSAPTLETLLESLESQSRRDFETIVIDDASTDTTSELVQRFNVRYERLDTNSGPATARNRGATLASGEWLIFADADTEFMPDTLERIDQVLLDSDADALVGTYSGKPANDGFVPRYKALWEYVTIDLGLIPDARGLTSIGTWAPRPGIARKSAFDAVGGFDTAFRGADLEDMEFGYRLHAAGYRIYMAHNVRIKHNYPATATKELKAFARRSALWMRMNRSRKQFDATGEGSGSQALAHLVGFAAFWLILASLPFPPIGLIFAAALLLYAYLNRRFLRLALQQEGIFFTIKAFLYCWLHSITLGFAAAYGLLTPSPGDS